MRTILPLVLVAMFSAGCAEEEKDTGPTCDDRVKTAGACPGVTGAAITMEGIACTQTIAAANAADLDAKLPTAAAGACVVLNEGSYGVASLPAGVSLVGKGASKTTVEGIVTKGAAGGATIRGVTVGTGGIAVSERGTLTIEKVKVSGAASFGVHAVDTSVIVRDTSIFNGTTTGLVASCRGADCASSRPKLTLVRTWVYGNMRVGVLANGFDVDIDTVEVASTRASSFLYGRGLEVAGGGSLVARRLSAVGNEDVGVFVEGGAVDIVGLTVARNVRGIQLQAIPAAGGKLEDFVVADNQALGIGIDKGSKGLIVQGGRVASTTAVKVPVDVGGMQEVGDGINWLDGSEVTIASTVRIESSGRRPLIIEANAKGKFEGTLAGGDETRGLIVQGGLVASMPETITVAAGVKTDVLTKDNALPVAVTMAPGAP
ncbi:MAG: right-handed parallel beta-helix repeat-containing protein [Deltaproteobacteria bacterium]|nr:right-handed parallel beta-helix repeat-containing protein [Deltaproteobacteria bacterium]